MIDVVQEPKKTKSIALAMMLNAVPLVIFGLGYIYIGKWMRFIVVELLQLFGLISFFVWDFRTTYFVGFLWLASVIDVMIQTSNYNEQARRPII